VSVSSQSDAEKAYIAKEKRELKEDPEAELEELTVGYEAKGLSRKTAQQVAKELTAIDPVKAHLAMEFQLDEDDVVNPMHAAVASFISFTVGGLIPFLAMMLAPATLRIEATIVAVFVALLLTGYGSARVGGASHGRAMARVVLGGLAAMAITYYIGQFFGTKIA
jgi:VIT1/CCC1 family predicted Fe2+/Mn2+ transporter